MKNKKVWIPIIIILLLFSSIAIIVLTTNPGIVDLSPSPDGGGADDADSDGDGTSDSQDDDDDNDGIPDTEDDDDDGDGIPDGEENQEVEDDSSPIISDFKLNKIKDTDGNFIVIEDKKTHHILQDDTEESLIFSLTDDHLIFMDYGVGGAKCSIEVFVYDLASENDDGSFPIVNYYDFTVGHGELFDLAEDRNCYSADHYYTDVDITVPKVDFVYGYLYTYKIVAYDDFYNARATDISFTASKPADYVVLQEPVSGQTFTDSIPFVITIKGDIAVSSAELKVMNTDTLSVVDTIELNRTEDELWNGEWLFDLDSLNDGLYALDVWTYWAETPDSKDTNTLVFPDLFKINIDTEGADGEDGDGGDSYVPPEFPMELVVKIGVSIAAGVLIIVVISIIIKRRKKKNE